MRIIKIISGNLKDKNIQINCGCCHCTYEVESRDDFKIHWVLKHLSNGSYDYNTEIPSYSVICPQCGYEIFIGLDEEDYDGVKVYRNLFNKIIMNRPDWKNRYKVKPRGRSY